MDADATLLPPVPERLAHLPAYVAGRSALELCAERGITDVLVLAANESAVGPAPGVIEAVREAAAEVHRYPDSGTRALRGALARHHGVGEETIVTASGAEQILGLLALALLEPRDEAVMPTPSFPVYRIATLAAGGRAVEVTLPGWGYDAEALARAVGPRTRLVLIANPNNPTGTYLGEDGLRLLLKTLPAGALLVLDEAYWEYADAPDWPDGLEALRTHPQVVIVRTLSKAYGLAGLRVGYLVARPQVAELVARVRPAFAVSSVAERAALAALADPGHVARGVEVNRQGRRLLQGELAERGLECPSSQANFVWCGTGEDDDRVWHRLIDQGVVVRGGSLWGYPGHLRVTVGTREQNERFLRALDRARSPCPPTPAG